MKIEAVVNFGPETLSAIDRLIDVVTKCLDEVDRQEALVENVRLTPTNPAPRKPGRPPKAAKSEPAPVVESVVKEEDEDDDFAPRKTAPKSKALAAFDDDAEDDEELPLVPPLKIAEPEIEEDADEDDEDFTTPVKKPAKAKKLTLDDVNDACKARAGRVGGKIGRAEVLAILKKKFKTETVSELKPDQYEAVVAAMAV